MFSFIKNAFSSLYKNFFSLFEKKSLQDSDMLLLEKELLSNDFGYNLTQEILLEIKEKYRERNLSGEELRSYLLEALTKMIKTSKTINHLKNVYVMSGVNGAGKTSTCIKLALYFKTKNEKVLVVAGDTFRAAAQEQLVNAAKKNDIDFFSRAELKDPSAAIFQGLTFAKKEGYSKIIIDTSGRLQTKEYLMRELDKIDRVIQKIYSKEFINHILVIDGLLGQNSIDQARVFNQILSVDGIILTKMDAQHKPGAVFAIVKSLSIPIAFVTFGEKVENIEIFNEITFVKNLF